MSSLQDQLLKAGLVDAKQAKKVTKDKRKNQKVQKKSKQIVVDENKEAAAKKHSEKVERDRLLNQKRKAAADEKAIAAQIKQLIQMNRVAKGGGELLGYNFTDGKHIKKILVSADIQKQLERGRLAIVRFDNAGITDNYELVPAVVADKISQRDANSIISQQVVSNEIDEEDPYADFQIPDDLMW
jgi:uncharacterized protein YaiL (DUF2058 family)